MRPTPSANSLRFSFVASLASHLAAGEHLLGTAKLSPLNQLAAPLLAGQARLFVAADLQGDTGSSSSTGSGAKGMLPLLAAIRHMQAVCAKGRAAAQASQAGSAAACPDSWLPAQQFLEQLEQRRLAEQQRKAETAALAAAEADRRARLQQAARERRQDAQALPVSPAARQQQQQQQPGIVEAGPRGGPGYRPSPSGSPAKRPGTGAQQPQPASPPAADEAAPPAGHREAAVGQQAAAAVAPDKPGPAGPVDASVGSSVDSLQQLRQRFQSLYSLTLGEGAASPSMQPTAAGVPSTAAPAAPVPAQPAQPPMASHQTIAAGVAAADDIAVHVAALRMQAAAEARRALQAEQQLLGNQAAAGDNAAAEPASFTCSGRYGGIRSSSSEGASAGGASRPSSAGGLAEQLQDELLLFQHQAAQAAEYGAATSELTLAAAGPGISPQVCGRWVACN